MIDLFGKALLDFQTNFAPEDLVTETNLSETDKMSVKYLFRSFKEMPKLEKKAMKLCKGRILDVGCGAGSHSLYLQNRGYEVVAIDISANAIKACELRGLKTTRNQNVLDVKNEKFDTVIVLMNGTGIFRTLKETPTYLQKLKSLINPKGQILIDSSDIIYMFDENDDGSKYIPTKGYYGELTFSISYKGETEVAFPWLYMDYKTLQNAAQENGLRCELILEGDHFDYLARLSL